MGDFLGSYYTDLDEGKSKEIALLRAEQPVSVVLMEQVATRGKTETNGATSRVNAIDQLQPTELACSRAGSMDDMEIPVASMSLFEDLLVSVKLCSQKLSRLAVEGLHNAEQKPNLQAQVDNRTDGGAESVSGKSNPSLRSSLLRLIGRRRKEEDVVRK